jgi:hypothetical protein
LIDVRRGRPRNSAAAAISDAGVSNTGVGCCTSRAIRSPCGSAS